MTEVLHLLDFSRNAQVDLISWIEVGAVTIEDIRVEDLQRIKEMILQYSDLPMDFADACLVFLGEKLSISQIATIDRDFDIYNLKGKKSFTTYIK